MTDPQRSAKADAKAEKARAKAMRPWFKKKRFILSLGFVGLMVIIAAAGGGGSSSTNQSDDNTSNTASNNGDSDFSTNDENPPSADVKIVSCGKTVIDTVDVQLEVTNHSSKESDYTISITLEDSAGAKVGDGYASASNVDAGQVAKVEGFATLNTEGNFTCSIEEVERFAS